MCNAKATHILLLRYWNRLMSPVVCLCLLAKMICMCAKFGDGKAQAQPTMELDAATQSNWDTLIREAMHIVQHSSCFAFMAVMI